MVTCSSCASVNPDDAKFCNSCGAPLAAATNAADATVAEMPPDSYTTPEAVASPPPAGSPGPVYPPPPVYAPARPAKDRSIALILEIIPGLFGFLGIGWLYSGNTTAGIIWLIAFLVWTGLATLISVLTVGIGVICWLPISIACIVVSAINLNKYTKAHPELFGD